MIAEFTDGIENFFQVFNYDDLMHGAIDGGLVYEGITITRDLKTKSGFQLKKGEIFDAVWFLFKDGVFQFIHWKKIDDCNSEANIQTSVFIPQSELAPFLHWKDSP